MCYLLWGLAERIVDSGFYAACAGLKAQTQALELIANNTANINTTGFRAQQPNFSSMLASAQGELANPLNRVINDFSVLKGSRTDLSGGNLEHTGTVLDIGIEGAGFFAAQTKAGILYTRNGNFQISPNGQLSTSAGDLVLGEQGPIHLPGGQVSVSADGTISVDGAIAGKLRIVEFAAGSSLTSLGNSYYSAPAKAAAPAVSSYVREGMLESSNVNPVASVVQLISVQRHAEMLEQAMSMFATNLDRIAANDLPHV